MAIPFGEYYNSESFKGKRNDAHKRNNESKNNLFHGTQNSLQSPHICLASAQGSSASTTVYCVSDSTFLKCGPAFIKIPKGSNKGKLETGRRIKVRKGIFTSHRIITSEDIEMVAEAVREDWKKLVKKLPGVTVANLSFHQAFIDAMDRRDSRNMAEIALSTWKSVLPELSTISNLSQTLFNIGHPDVVTHLKP